MSGRGKSDSFLLAAWFPLICLGVLVASLPLGGGEIPDSAVPPLTLFQSGKGGVPPYSQIGVEV